MKEIVSALSLSQPYELVNKGNLPSCFSVSDLAASAIGAVASSLSELAKDLNLVRNVPHTTIDQTLASLWFAQSIHPIDWQLPPVWDAIAGDYRTRDGWIKLHTNLRHHREAALSILNCSSTKAEVSKAVAQWNGNDLETEIVESGGVAAALRTRQEWTSHPQGAAVTQEPLISFSKPRDGKPREWQPSSQRPLNGLRVLDLTRVLAGPVASRTLAGFGAKVLRIDPPGWDEPNVVPDVTLGKRCAYLDLEKLEDRSIFEGLLTDAHILIHGYRPGALDHLGYYQTIRQNLAPNLIEISLNAYGWSGPWKNRRGFDSLVQMSSGIASYGMLTFKTQRPTPLPVQALDHATGYLMASAALRLISSAVNNHEIGSARLSLARTAELLKSYPQRFQNSISTSPEEHQFEGSRENTPWGLANRLKPAIQIEGIPMYWDYSASQLGSQTATWDF